MILSFFESMAARLWLSCAARSHSRRVGRIICFSSHLVCVISCFRMLLQGNNAKLSLNRITSS